MDGSRSLLAGMIVRETSDLGCKLMSAKVVYNEKRIVAAISFGVPMKALCAHSTLGCSNYHRVADLGLPTIGNFGCY